MAKHKEQKIKYNGYVYVLKIWIGADIVYKVGTTNRTPLVRALEIAGELYRLLGYIPKMVILREKTTMDNYKVESEVLKLTNEYRYELLSDGTMCGESELRKCDELHLLKVYDECLVKDYPAVAMFKVCG